MGDQNTQTGEKKSLGKQYKTPQGLFISFFLSYLFSWFSLGASVRADRTKKRSVFTPRWDHLNFRESSDLTRRHLFLFAASLWQRRIQTWQPDVNSAGSPLNLTDVLPLWTLKKVSFHLSLTNIPPPLDQDACLLFSTVCSWCFYIFSILDTYCTVWKHWASMLA